MSSPANRRNVQEEAKRGVDLASLFSVDEAALRAAFKVDTSKLGAGLDLSGSISRGSTWAGWT